MRLKASIETGAVVPSVILRKLAAAGAGNVLSRALRALGRIDVGARRTPRMGAHRSDRRLRLDRDEPRRAVSAATRSSFYVPGPGRLAYDFEQIVW